MKLNKPFLSIIVILFMYLSSLSAKSAISDSLHVKHYGIYIDSMNFTAQTIKGSCTVHFEAKQNNVILLKLSLLKLIIDSIMINGVVVQYNYDDTNLVIPSPFPLMMNDTITALIIYHGSPVKDASGWGGFYFSSTHAFNMGVGFDAVPHNFGKAWFPCIDEFTDRSLYDFYITTSNTQKAFCNGILVTSIANPGNTVTWHWKMNQPIASYLASIAVSNFYTLKRTSNNIPVEWGCAIGDTSTVLNTFQHLDTILSSFITAYGPYPFDKAGYVLVPFNSGAMEHATSIHIGSAFISGLTYETLWAHELSHMWWGDKVTCESEGDMWLNEGFASFNEAFMTEKVYGKTAYKNWLRSNHKKVLQFAHIDDASYLSLINVPHAYTYGTTVYKKSIGVLHTLRNYVGDSAFFNACRYYMSNRAYSTGNSYQLRDDFTAATGINMNRFFDDWVFKEGFPHFSIDSVVYQPGGLDHYFVYVRQRSKGNNHLYNMPLEINLTDGINDTTFSVIIDSTTQMFHCPIFFIATMLSLDRNEKISDAITDYEKWITSNGTVIFNETNTTLNTLSTGIDSSLVRVEHHWVRPDGWKQSNPGIRISDYHYWEVDGILKPGYNARLSFSYNGSNSTTTGHIDNSLITTSEDSLVLLFRTGAGDDWHLLTNTTLITGASLNDKVGTIRIDSLVPGEYVLGIRDYTVGITSENNFNTNDLIAVPNPSGDTFKIHYKIKSSQKAILRITSSDGKNVFEKTLNSDDTFVQWDSANHPEGIYIANLIINKKIAQSIRLSHIK
jgi:Peptidase family M1 domain/Peptidase M1 N-terminal domain